MSMDLFPRSCTVHKAFWIFTRLIRLLSFMLFFLTDTWSHTSTIFDLNAHIHNARTLHLSKMSFFSLPMFFFFFFFAVIVSTLDKWLFPLICRCCRTAPKPGVRWSCTSEPRPVLTSCVSSMYTRTCTRAASAYSSSWSGESYVCYSPAYVFIAMSECASGVHPPQPKVCRCEILQ